MIRTSEARDHAALKALWMRVFGDGPEAVDAYFAHRHADEDMLIWDEDGRAQAMLSMLPLTLVNGGVEYAARYIYAVATAPELRGRGIAGDLLERAGDWIRARGESAAVLVPASASLFDYYEKRGFHTAFFLDVVDFHAESLPAAPEGGVAERCSAAAYARMRDRALSGAGLYARWDEDAVAYAIRTQENGGAMRMRLGDGEGVALWSRGEDGSALVRELALDGIDVPEAMALLHGAVGAPTYRVRLPADAQRVPFGMIRWYVPEPEVQGPGYLSLALD